MAKKKPSLKPDVLKKEVKKEENEEEGEVKVVIKGGKKKPKIKVPKTPEEKFMDWAKVWTVGLGIQLGNITSLSEDMLNTITNAIVDEQLHALNSGIADIIDQNKEMITILSEISKQLVPFMQYVVKDNFSTETHEAEAVITNKSVTGKKIVKKAAPKKKKMKTNMDSLQEKPKAAFKPKPKQQEVNDVLVPEGYRKIVGFLEAETKKAVLIQFPDDDVDANVLNGVWIPKSQMTEDYINLNRGGKEIEQEFIINEWILEKNKVIVIDR